MCARFSHEFGPVKQEETLIELGQGGEKLRAELVHMVRSFGPRCAPQSTKAITRRGTWGGL